MNKSNFLSTVLLCALVLSDIGQGCHNYHHRKKRQTDGNNLTLINDIRRTDYLRRFFTECLERKAPQTLQSYETALDFTILDGRWYEQSDLAECSDNANRDTPECWRSRLNRYLKPTSPLLPLSKECVQDYAEGYTPNCTDGRWTKFFNRDSPGSGGGDIENVKDLIKENSVCSNPTSIDVRLSNGSDYRVGNQNVQIGLNFGLECNHNSQSNSQDCLDYMVRFCCPDIPVAPPRLLRSIITKRQASSSFVTTPSENLEYGSCISDSLDLPSIRNPVDLDTLISLAQNHLLCNSSTGIDCSLNGPTVANLTTSDKNRLVMTWPWLLEAVTKESSSLFEAFSTCNPEVFPVQSTLSRIGTGIVPTSGWSQWSVWGHCPARCGEPGSRLRRRQCLSGPPGIHPCIGSIHDIEPCQPPHCPFWSSWNPWSACPDRLVTSYRFRSRVCVNGSVGNYGCEGLAVGSASCGMESTSSPNGKYLSKWSSWDPCPAHCGIVGIQRRRRHCTRSDLGPAACAGATEEMRQCTPRGCPSWNAWSSWSSCTATCGSSVGFRGRTRQCILINEVGIGCKGNPAQVVPCGPLECPTGVNRNIGAWTGYGACQGDCGNLKGFQERTRECRTGPRGSNGCAGPFSDKKACTRRCAYWGEWSQFSACSASCGVGEQFRHRQCTNGIVGEVGCIGKSTESSACNTETCGRVTEGGWSSWSSWEYCPAQCNQKAIQVRRRFCTTSSARCPGSSLGERECTKQCGRWSQWSRFSSCLGRCGTSSHSRSRTCLGGVAGQEGCYGSAVEERQCYTGRPC